MVVFVFSELRWEVVARFVDLGHIVDHHCLNFIYIICYDKNFQTFCNALFDNRTLIYFCMSWYIDSQNTNVFDPFLDKISVTEYQSTT
jgi:hypothetical protein